MPVVSDSSPLILFAKIGQLNLLRSLYEELLIPAAVHREVVEQGAGKPGAAEIVQAPWIKVEPILLSSAAQIGGDLGAGETEAIALARGHEYMLIVDDRGGREAATSAGVTVTGSAGVLLAAKRRGLLHAVRPVLDALIAAELRLDPPLYRRVLELAGEWEAE